MGNLPILVSFAPGTGGRFIQAAINYLVTGWPLPVIDKAGASHNRSEGEQMAGPFIFLWDDTFDDEYIKLFGNDLTQTINDIDFLPWRNDPNKNKFYIVEDINRSGNHIEKTELILSHLSNTKYAAVVRTHIVNIQMLRLIAKQLTLVHIYASTLLDVTTLQRNDVTKNYLKFSDPLSVTPDDILAYTIPTNHIVDMPDPKSNEFFLPFDKIRTKDITYVIAFLLRIAHYCNIPVSDEQLINIRRFVDEYFSKQP